MVGMMVGVGVTLGVSVDVAVGVRLGVSVIVADALGLGLTVGVAAATPGMEQPVNKMRHRHRSKLFFFIFYGVVLI
jgi:hypothetical protein